MSESAGHMHGNRRKVEILAPVGSEQCLQAAVRSGADAVYLGGESLNARRAAANFDSGQLAQAVRYCHVRGVRAYLTLNTLVFDSELPELEKALRSACDAGLDAVIVQDLATARLVRERAPGLALHASTQMGVHDAAGAAMLQRLGFSRVVLARELSATEIREIRGACDMDLECFVHGALCMSVSGQCYLSSMIGGRSGNRGLCAQPCRLPFSCGGQDHALSLRDLSLIDRMPGLLELGVCSLKIEGRMKRPEYVAAAVAACRRALDGQQPDYGALEAVFSRSGFTAGYFDGVRGREMFGTRRKQDVQAAAPVLKELSALYQRERQSVPVAFACTLKRGVPAALQATDPDGNIAAVCGDAPQEAEVVCTTAARVEAALKKTGGTPYTVCNIESQIDDGVMVPAAQLNAMRREALDQLTGLREQGQRIPYTEASLPILPKHCVKGSPRLRVRLARFGQLTEELGQLADEIVLPVEECIHLTKEAHSRFATKLLVEIPTIRFGDVYKIREILQGAIELGVEHLVAGDLGAIALAAEHGMQIHGDYSLNITNALALDEYARLGLADATLSFELERPRLHKMGGELPRGILAYGYLPLMTMRNCPVGACASCKRDFPQLADRKGNRFFVDCIWQVARLYNCVPLFLADRLEEFAGMDFFTLYFTRESAGDCVRIARLYRDRGACDAPKTRGLYYRTVL